MSYAVIEYKTYRESMPRNLADLEEVRHTLYKVSESDGRCIAEFPCGNFIFPMELTEQLQGLVGRKIAMLRLDGQYYVRDLDSENHA